MRPPAYRAGCRAGLAISVASVLSQFVSARQRERFRAPSSEMLFRAVDTVAMIGQSLVSGVDRPLG